MSSCPLWVFEKQVLSFLTLPSTRASSIRSVRGRKPLHRCLSLMNYASRTFQMIKVLNSPLWNEIILSERMLYLQLIFKSAYRYSLKTQYMWMLFFSFFSPAIFRHICSCLCVYSCSWALKEVLIEESNMLHAINISILLLSELWNGTL